MVERGRGRSLSLLKRLWAFGYERQKEIALFNYGLEKGHEPNFSWEDAHPDQLGLRREIHVILKQANDDYRRCQFNTVVAACMKILNLLMTRNMGTGPVNSDGRRYLMSARDYIQNEGFGILLRILAPIAPHITQTLWRSLKFVDDVLNAPWPKVDTDALRQDTLEIVVQVNGKLRGRVSVPAAAGEDRVREIALADEAVARYVAGKVVKKVIVVPGKLVNIVVAD